MGLVKEVYASWRAEVVFITSNRQGNQEIMEGCKEAGIPAFVSKAHGLRLMTTDLVRASGNTVGLLMKWWLVPHRQALFTYSTSKSSGLAKDALSRVGTPIGRSVAVQGPDALQAEETSCVVSYRYL
ncbi:hypothetical protein EDB84DRAFT_903855 [Lactarius hengduanensis]|nr:hypothetical protein EDB84DRAFT_903855 [Lactarius hengduanensis]